ncbi:hypothetical protein ASD48_35090 [Streptomyces sp. Root1310]|nr:hypothetical protein ASD48_35090 [Streptomyces sp. Root1310]
MCVMGSARGRTFGFGTATLVACFGTAAMLMRALGSSTGDIDPIGAAVGITSLVVSVWGAFVTWRSARWQETDLTDASARLALLLRTRRWTRQPLPWRLGHFLRWCYRSGLIRVAGTAYQFRHRELQDHLARHAPPRT